MSEWPEALAEVVVFSPASGTGHRYVLIHVKMSVQERLRPALLKNRPTSHECLHRVHASPGKR